MEYIVRITKLTMNKILVFTMFCVALIAADQTQTRYNIHRTTGSESVTSTCLIQCAAKFSSFEAAGVRVSGSQCLCEALNIDWALALPLQMSPGYVYMVKQESTQTFTQKNIDWGWDLKNLPIIMSGTVLNVTCAPITTLGSVNVGFAFGDKDHPLMLYMDFANQMASIVALINGAWLYQYGIEPKAPFTASVTSQQTITLEVDLAGLIHIYLDGVKIMNFSYLNLTDVRRSNKFYVRASPNASLIRLEFKRLR